MAEALAELGADAVEEVMESGLETAMNRYNGRRAGTEEEVEDREDVSGRAPRGPA